MIRKISNLGLSCIENYILEELIPKVKNYKWIFAYSICPLKDVLDYVIIGEHSYENYYAIPRIQDIAQKHIIISYDRYEIQSLEEIENVQFSDILLLKVNNDFMFENFGIRTWRDDHYIRILELAENEVLFRNDYPAKMEWMPRRNIQNLDELKIVKINLLCEAISNESIEKLKNIRDKNVKNFNKEINVADYKKNSAVSLRDLVGILKILRKRANILQDKEIVGNYYFEELENIQFKLEYMRLKKKENKEDLWKFLNYIIELDKKHLLEISHG